MQHKLLHPQRIFTLFKFLVFSALFINLWLFAHEDMRTAMVRFPEGVSGIDTMIEVYAQTIDSAAWILLLALFELETSYIPDAYLRRARIKWSLHGLRALSALVLVNSMIGYMEKYETYLAASVLDQDVCALAGQGWLLLTGLDEFLPLASADCSAMAATASLLPGLRAVASADVLGDVQRLALIDVINAVAWVLVVVLLEMDVRLQLRGLLKGWVLRVSTGLKTITYATLLAAAVYWGLHGSFIDFWDAFLWLAAFVFIEMNIFQWQREVRERERAPVVRR